ncbi:MAG TPA: cytochrome c [Verrucomicrobiae bacterium]|jgi:mono/diheme cytochrome c family protein|nr:cytochrome c [Verrucomicrobiae bacterium]
MKRGTLILILLSAVVLAVAFMAYSLLHNGVSAKATPSAIEVMMARRARHMALPSEARSLVNPVAATEENLRDGRLHFADHCAICHGNDGSCDTMMGSGLYPKPPDLRLAETQKLSDGELFWIIENGVRFTGMPAFSTRHSSPEDSWKLVLFIRHLPQLTADERIEMERNNPKSPADLLEEQQENDFLNGKTPAPPAELHHH